LLSSKKPKQLRVEREGSDLTHYKINTWSGQFCTFGSHSAGNIAATLSKQRGPVEAFLRINFRANFKLPKVSGFSGNDKRIFINNSKEVIYITVTVKIGEGLNNIL